MTRSNPRVIFDPLNILLLGSCDNYKIGFERLPLQTGYQALRFFRTAFSGNDDICAHVACLARPGGSVKSPLIMRN